MITKGPIKMIKITLPLKVMMVKKSRKTGKPGYFILNLNNYRNAHYLTLAKAKRKYSEIVKGLLEDIDTDLKLEPPLKLRYIYYAARDNVLDTNNPLSIIDKFTCDALTESDIWSDDNSRVIRRSVLDFGGVDPANPRVELIISEMSLRY